VRYSKQTYVSVVHIHTRKACGMASDRSYVNQSINRLFAHNTSSSETTRASRRDEQDSQAPVALMAALIKHTKFPKTVLKQVYKCLKCNAHSVRGRRTLLPSLRGPIHLFKCWLQSDVDGVDESARCLSNSSTRRRHSGGPGRLQRVSTGHQNLSRSLLDRRETAAKHRRQHGAQRTYAHRIAKVAIISRVAH